MVVDRNTRFVRVCFQLRYPPVNIGRTPSMMKFSDMHTTIQPNFCQDGMSSKKVKNWSMTTRDFLLTIISPAGRVPRSICERVNEEVPFMHEGVHDVCLVRSICWIG